MPTSAEAAADAPWLGERLRAMPEFAGDLIALAYIALIATIATLTGAIFVMFPELGALSQDVFARPRGTWGSSPLFVAITPVLTGIVGSLITNLLPYGLISVLLIVGASFFIIEALNSPVAPAISAGLLPLVVGIHSWWYAPGIMLGCFLLAILSIPWKRMMAPPDGLPLQTHEDHAANVLEAPASRRWWLIPLLGFVAAATILAELTGLRFILFPPLVVIGFEMFGHTDICPWAQKPLWLPLACFLTAAGGLFFLKLLGFGPLAAAADMAWGILILRVFNLHVPPAFAVALLPMVMHKPDLTYPFSVGAGTLLMTLWFLFWQSRVMGARVQPFHKAETVTPESPPKEAAARPVPVSSE
jgi:hypothetical protein